MPISPIDSNVPKSRIGPTVEHEAERSEFQKEFEGKLIEHLRKEAFEVKDCFTKYSFQGIAITTAILGLFLKFGTDDSGIYVGLTGVFLLLLMQTIASIGTHKYATSNRLMGYELHLERTLRGSHLALPAWDVRMRDIGWEEALGAWRIVQSTVFDFLFVHGNMQGPQPEENDGSKWQKFLRTLKNSFLEGVRFFERNILNRFYRLRPDQLRKTLTDSQGKPIEIPTGGYWFEPRTYLNKISSVGYYPGGYLQTMLNVIYLVSFICFLPTVYVPIKLYLIGRLAEFAILLFILIPFWAFIFNRFRLTYYRRKLLEEGYLSIYSCSMMWQASVISHFLSLPDEKDLKSASEPNEAFPDAYSKNLANNAIKIADNIFHMDFWFPPKDLDRIRKIPPNDWKKDPKDSSSSSDVQKQLIVEVSGSDMAQDPKQR